MHITNREWIFHITADMIYNDIIRLLSNRLNIDLRQSNKFLLQLYDKRLKLFLEIDDDYINKLRRRMSHNTIEYIRARILHRRSRRKQTVPDAIQLESTSCHVSLNGTHIKRLSPPQRVIWIDEYFVQPNNFRYIKKYLFSALQPEGPVYSRFHPQDYIIDTLIRNDVDLSHDVDGSSILEFFDNINDFLEYLHTHSTEKILLITSDSIGRQILPRISDQVLMTYILRDSWYDYEWGLCYINRIQMFDFDLDLITRVFQDLANYVIVYAEQLSLKEAICYLNWAKKLFLQSNVTDHKPPRYYSIIRTAIIERKLNNLDIQLKEPEENGDNVWEANDDMITIA